MLEFTGSKKNDGEIEIKVKVRAILILDNKVILIKRTKPLEEDYFVFPGGSMEKTDESLEMAVERECLEELGVEVASKRLLFETKRDDYVEYFFLVDFNSGIIGTGNGPEFQAGMRYVGSHTPILVPLQNLKDLKIFPTEAKDYLINEFQHEYQYLGC